MIMENNCREKRRSTHSFLVIVFFQFLLTHFVFLSFPNLSYYYLIKKTFEKNKVVKIILMKMLFI